MKLFILMLYVFVSALIYTLIFGGSKFNKKKKDDWIKLGQCIIWPISLSIEAWKIRKEEKK